MRRRFTLRVMPLVVLLSTVGLVAVDSASVAAATNVWSQMASPSPNSQNVLFGPYCLSSTDCVAVGYTEPSPQETDTLIESWNGTTWSVVPSPNAATFLNLLTSVFCTSAVSCIAVGYYQTLGDNSQTLIESWDGSTWQIVSSPDVPSVANQLFHITCISANVCIAAGVAGKTTLFESWNGSVWSIVASPVFKGHKSIWSVSCVSASYCMAVGDVLSKKKTTTLVEFWNGSSWMHISSPDPGTTGNVLSDVSCTSVKSCIAVGYFEGSTGSGPLTELWNGTQWSIGKSNARAGQLYSVTCLSSTMCVGAGAGAGQARVENTVIETWNGKRWAVATSPDPSTKVNSVEGISCAGPTFCVTTGFYRASTNTDLTLILSGQA